MSKRLRQLSPQASSGSSVSVDKEITWLSHDIQHDIASCLPASNWHSHTIRFDRFRSFDVCKLPRERERERGHTSVNQRASYESLTMVKCTHFQWCNQTEQACWGHEDHLEQEVQSMWNKYTQSSYYTQWHLDSFSTSASPGFTPSLQWIRMCEHNLVPHYTIQLATHWMTTGGSVGDRAIEPGGLHRDSLAYGWRRKLGCVSS